MLLGILYHIYINADMHIDGKQTKRNLRKKGFELWMKDR